MSEALFPDAGLRFEPEPEPKVTAGAKMRARQARLIAQGWHPLSMQHGALILLHRETDRPQASDGVRDGLRCGGCAHRVQVGGYARNYPKCVFGWKGTMETAPRASMSEATDVRAWWPACRDWEAKA